MNRNQREFTEDEKAEIFARDRATCCFSGANLWLLDAPLRPGYQRDWADHVRPLARGGKSEVDNGVCASHSYNAKKRHNTADNLYIFREGAPTKNYFEIFGPLPDHMASRLGRLAALEKKDWYFNRAVGLVFLAFDYELSKAMGYDLPIRDDEYWLKSAGKKLAQFKKLGGTVDFEARGLLKSPSATQIAWMEMADSGSDAVFKKIMRLLQSEYIRNGRIWASFFWDAKTDRERQSVLLKARQDKNVSEDVIQCLEGTVGCYCSC